MKPTPGNFTVAMLDSGGGGLSIAKEIIHKRWNTDLVYLADHKHYPYGLLDDERIVDRCLKLVTHLVEQYSPEVIVIACNTASTIVLDELRKVFTLPIIGVVPAVKPASAKTDSGAIGILATPATVNRPYLLNLIRKYAADAEVATHGSNVLVALGEDKLLGREIYQKTIVGELERLFTKQPKIDVLVLACTHFPLLYDEFRSALVAMDKSLHILDSGSAIANRLGHVCSQHILNVSSFTERKIHLLSTSKSRQTDYENFIYNAFDDVIDDEYQPNIDNNLDKLNQLQDVNASRGFTGKLVVSSDYIDL